MSLAVRIRSLASLYALRGPSQLMSTVDADKGRCQGRAPAGCQSGGML
jgi:hypothetical protein